MEGGRWDLYFIVDVTVLSERIAAGFTGAVVLDSIKGSHDCVLIITTLILSLDRSKNSK